MKTKILAIVFFFGMFSNVLAQDWLTSFDVAKSLGLVQNKLLFVVWEDASYESYPVLVKDGNNAVVEDLFSNPILNEAIWERFVPVVLSESKYVELFSEIKDKRSPSYIDKFNDDTIKIMDVNGNIVNTQMGYYDYLDIVDFLSKYALDTSYLNTELKHYRDHKDFNTTYRLTSKYIDFAIVVNENVRSEILQVSNYYMSDALLLLQEEPSDMHSQLKQKLELLSLKQQLVLDNPRKVLRKLRRLEPSRIADANQNLWAFLHYTSYLMLGDEGNASKWRPEISLADIKKASLLVKIHS